MRLGSQTQSQMTLEADSLLLGRFSLPLVGVRGTTVWGRESRAKGIGRKDWADWTGGVKENGGGIGGLGKSMIGWGIALRVG